MTLWNSAIFTTHCRANEPVLSYAPGSPEKKRLKEVLDLLKKEQVDVPMYIGGLEVRTNKRETMHPPHEIKHVLGHYHTGEEKHVKQAIEAALAARESWAADELGKPRAYLLKSGRSYCYQIPCIYERYYHAGPK